jgi:hypothetical protein
LVGVNTINNSIIINDLINFDNLFNFIIFDL